jgi:acetylornithine deacetylase
MSFVIDEHFLQQTLVELVQIDSRNPSIEAGGPGEAEIAKYIARLLKRLGMDVHNHDLGQNRLNVVGVLHGQGGGRSLILNGHMDTVGVAEMEDPFSGTIQDGKLFGRGSQDMKGGLTAMITAIKALSDANIPLKGDILFTAVADEEYLSIGTEDLVKHYSANAAIVTEPTDMTLCRAHRGRVWYEIETIGKAAHGSHFKDGIDANMHMGLFLAELDTLEKELRQQTPHPLLGPPSLHAALLQGGTDISTYAARCELKVEWRYIPGETVEQTTRRLQEIIDKLTQSIPTFKASLKIFDQRPLFDISEDADIVRVVETAFQNRMGRLPQHTGAAFWADSALLSAAGIDTLMIGPKGEGLHSEKEWVDVSSVVDLAHILAETCLEFCGTN